MTQQSESNGGGAPVENPNAEVIAGLREAADFLEQHPEMPAARYAWVVLRDRGYGASDPTAREELSAIADALGDRAEERESAGTVRIRGTFSGGVHVDGEAEVRHLLPSPPPAPEYEPIIKRAPEPEGAAA